MRMTAIDAQYIAIEHGRELMALDGVILPRSYYMP